MKGYGARPPALVLGSLLFGLAGALACNDPVNGGGIEHLGGVRQLQAIEVPEGFGGGKAALDDRRLYADLDTAAGVVAMDRENGERLWEYDRAVGAPASITVHRGRILFAGELAVALDSETGEELWRYFPGVAQEDNASFGMTAAAGSGFYFGAGSEILAVSVEDGSLLWRTDVGPDWEFRVIGRGLSVAGDTVYASIERYLAQNGHLGHAYVVALDRHTGEEFWRYQEGDGTWNHNFWGAPTVAGDRLLMNEHRTNTTVALDRMTGELAWKTPGDLCCFGAFHPPEVSNDTVYVGSNDRRVTALALETGEVIWRTQLPGGLSWIGLCGTRLLANDLASFWVLDRLTGETLGVWDHYEESNGAIMESIVVDEEALEAYVLCSRHLHVFQCPG